MTTRITAVLVGASFAVGLGYGAILPLLPPILARMGAEAGATSVGLHAGGLTGLYMLAMFAGAIAWGRAADRLGVRTTLLAGLLGYAASLVLLAAVTAPAWVYAVRVLAGFFAGAVAPAAGARAAADPDPVRRARLFAATGAATLLGLLAGPALSGGIVRLMARMPGADDMSTMTLLWPMAASAFVAIAVAAVVVRTVGLGRPAGTASRPDPAVAPAWSPSTALVAANFLVLLGVGAFEVTLPLLGTRELGLDGGSLALLFAECSAVMLLVQVTLFFSPALARTPARAVLAGGFALMVVGAAALALARTTTEAFVAVGVLAASSGWLLPAIGYFASSAANASATLLGVLSGFGVLGQAVGSAAGGWLYDRAAGGALWLLAATLAAGIVIALRGELEPAGARPKVVAGVEPASDGRC